jgi:hypothetical protein
MPEFEHSWGELVEHYDVWLDESASTRPTPEQNAPLLPPPAAWITLADTLTGSWKRGPADSWLRLDADGRETVYALTWDQLQRVPGGVRVRPASPTGRMRVEHPPATQPVRHYSWEDVKGTRAPRAPLFDGVEELEPLDAYGVLRGVVVCGDAFAAMLDESFYDRDPRRPEQLPVRARIPGVGEPDRYYSVVDVDPVRRDGRLTVELLLMPEPTEEGGER